MASGRLRRLAGKKHAQAARRFKKTEVCQMSTMQKYLDALQW